MSLVPATVGAVPLALVGVGGAFGSVVRWSLSERFAVNNNLDVATLMINLTGSFLLGLMLRWQVVCGSQTPRMHHTRLLLGTGFLGGFTTYSAFAVELVSGVSLGAYGTALLYAVVSLCGGVLAAWCGVVCASRLGRPPGHQRSP